MAANISHPAFSQPKDNHVPIWRYMDFVKYVAMLSSGSLYFSRADKLGDPFEGSLTIKEYQAIKKRAEEAESAGTLPKFWRGKYFEVLMHAWRSSPKQNYALCWHMNSGESEAMWKIYIASNLGVAIRSNYQTLVDALPSTYEPKEYRGPFVGKINYIDYEKETFENMNIFYSILHKRLSFEHERECRAIIWKCGNHKGPDPLPLTVLENNSAGILIKAPLNDLIQKVVVSPNAPSWFIEVVKNTSEKFGYNFNITSSEQSLQPYL